MSATALGSVISHWDCLHEGLQESPQAFYQAVEDALNRRQIPDARISRVEHKEAGVLSAKRLYLRVEREQLVFDICGAPFGTGFFTSWWLAEPSVDLNGLVKAATLLGILGLAGWLMAEWGLIVGFFAFAVMLFAFVWAVASGPMKGTDLERFVQAMPVLGTLYRMFVKPDTYYRMDSTLMFQHAVHNAVMEVIDTITTTKGIRALTESERKPIMRDFFTRGR
jgi:hypothetical protein